MGRQILGIPARSDLAIRESREGLGMSGLVEIVGRAEPLSRLGRALASSATGSPAAVLVSGSSGIGKTTLIRAGLSRREPMTVAWGTCWPGEGAPGFWPWMQAFDDVVRQLGPEAATLAAGRDVATLSALVRDLGSTAPGVEPSDRQRILLLDAAVRWLATLAGERHIAVVLDDLQWADTSSLDLLDHLIARPVNAALTVIGAYRHDELSDELASRVDRLAVRAEHLHLEGLDLAEVTELVASLTDRERADRDAGDIHARTSGHPLFVAELARMIGAERPGVLPSAVTGAVSRRLLGLSGATRGALDVACVLGNQVLVDVVAGVLEIEPAEASAALAPAVDAGLLAQDGGLGLRFDHDLIRETLYGELGMERRTALHYRVGQTLETRSAGGGEISPVDVAGHLCAGLPLSDVDRVLVWARRAAADERRKSAFLEAAGHLQRARTAACEAGWSPQPGDLVDLLLEEADCRARSGDPDMARRLLAEAAGASAEPGDVAEIAVAVHRLGARFAARRDEVIAQLESALAVVAGTGSSGEARVMAALARELQHSVPEERHRAEPLSRAALEIGRASGEEATLIDCLLARHDTIWSPGTGEERARLGAEITDVAGRIGDADRVAEGLLLQANGLLESGSAAYRPPLDRWFAMLEARNEPRDVYLVATRRAAIALLDDRLDDAWELMIRAAALGDEIHEPDTGNVLMSQRVALAHARNDPLLLEELARDAVAHWTGTPIHAHSVAAGALAAAGDFDGAARELATVVDAGGWAGEGSYLRGVLIAHLAQAAAALGETELCRQLFDDVAPLAGACGVNGAVVAFAGPFAHTAGVLAAAMGEETRAIELIDRSIGIARRLGAATWVRLGEQTKAGMAGKPRSSPTSPALSASLVRTGAIWAVGWCDETGSVAHAKGMADLVQLVQRRGTEIPALELASPDGALPERRRDEAVDVKALRAYKNRLDEIEVELDDARADAALGVVDRLESEREKLLAEVRSVAGLAGRIRPAAADQAERARKAVSARIRDAIRRIEAVAPSLAAHLDRSVRTGLRCSYDPPVSESVVDWTIKS